MSKEQTLSISLNIEVEEAKAKLNDIESQLDRILEKQNAVQEQGK